MLEHLGHEVIEASGGREAIRLALASPPDTILMDLSMPDVDGLAAVAALKAISPLREVPVVAVTAFPQFTSREKALAAGCVAYLQKPFSIESLAMVLQTLPGAA
jgi:two-component system cell cycle response regulator